MLLQPINVVYHKNASITIVLGAMVMLLLFSSCSGKKKELGDAITERDSMAVMDTRGVTTLVSDSGVTRYRINTEEWLVFDRKNPPYWAFEKGVYLEKFDSIFQVEASIKADTAYFFNKEELWKLMGNVHIQNLKGEQFDTELLYWDQRTQRIYSDEFIRIEQPDRIITGHGFESNQQMTVYTYWERTMPDNGIVYFFVTDPLGVEHELPLDVYCMDFEAPTLRAGINGTLLRVEAYDDLSGVAAIFVNNALYTTLDNGELNVRIDNLTNDAYLYIDALDSAGNWTDYVVLANPFYEEEPEPTPTPTPTPTPDTSNNPHD